MLKTERKQLILEELNKHHVVSLEKLVSLLETSESTVRRDLDELEAENKLRRVHGGAELPHSLQEEETIQEKSVKNLQEKKLLAQKAASLIKEKDVIFIDAGTTTAFLIRELVNKNITVVTNSIHHAVQAVDKYVSIAVTDGSVQEYEVDKWEISEADKAKLSVAGSRIQMTGQLGGETIHATLVVEEGNPVAPAVPTVTVGGESVTGLTTQNPMQYRTLAYGASLPEVVASAENADVTVVQASAANGMRASIYVQPKDGGPLQTYAIQFLEEAPKIDHLSLQVEQADGLKEDQTVKLSVLAHYQDGTQAVLPADKVNFSTSGEGEVAVRFSLSDSSTST